MIKTSYNDICTMDKFWYYENLLMDKFISGKIVASKFIKDLQICYPNNNYKVIVALTFI